ncbi:zinc finger and SCAN domain-containing protein 29-like [Mauremys reevesii]|uniref:zinc finger and SCAN domain-containing protein 29-like n=1 Tax=Mauremys reevesii TaxID=260615 RepID=UPI0019401A6A|nr:zinc finger and SCAN domain-containing protein 29-like [Mauremys reevesii]
MWGEESIQMLLRVTQRNWDTHGQISRGLREKGYDWDTQQCRANIKELRQAYPKAWEVNYRSDGAPKTCRFYQELNAILSGDPTSIADSPVDTSHAAERVGSSQAEILDEEVELEEDVKLPAGSPSGAGSQELLATPEVLNGEQEADEVPDLEEHTTLPMDWLWQIRKNPGCRKEDMFWELLQCDETHTRERKVLGSQKAGQKRERCFC